VGFLDKRLGAFIGSRYGDLSSSAAGRGVLALGSAVRKLGFEIQGGDNHADARG
jgi:hypothetical protein